MYLVAILDWFSRYVVAWRLSNTLEMHFCLAALEEALSHAVPEIFNTDQGAQFTATAFVQCVQASGARMSMDGRGRALDNVFIERLWRSLKYENVYLRDYASVAELQDGLRRYFDFYNHGRKHQALGNRTPAAVHYGKPVEKLLKCCEFPMEISPSSPGPPSPLSRREHGGRGEADDDSYEVRT